MTRKARRFLPSLRWGLVSLLALAATDRALAATFTVTNLNNAGPGSLRRAVSDANASAGPDNVVFAPGLTGTITLTSGEIVITGSLVVHGPGAGLLTVNGNDLSRIFLVQNAAAAAIDVVLSGLTLTRGHALDAGGAVSVIGENLTILNSVISNSRAGAPFDPPTPGCGGNVALGSAGTGALRIVDSTLTGGLAEGIAESFGGNLCISGGSLILERSTLSAGIAHFGGGLALLGPTATGVILFSTISGNEGAEGGGVYAADGGELRIESSTISGNSTSFQGGGIFLAQSGGSLLLRLATVSNNTADVEGGSLLVSAPSFAVQLDHAIVANGAPEDLARPGPLPATVTANFSLIEAPGDTILAGANNLIGADPLLGPLASNGGPTLTHLPLAGSPVIDAGNPAIASPPPTDQRGFGRIGGPAIDKGSVEVQEILVLTEVPTLSQLGVLLLCALLFAAGIWKLRLAG